MKKHFLFTLFALFCSTAMLAQKIPTVYVDGKGMMRWSDTNNEASFYGVNYTLPFAHAYRAMGSLGVDRKKAIDRDVYHIARLGLNAYRIHLWDVELSDAEGNLLNNDHLDLMDYLIMKLKERGIRIVITAQTNFGNGYPEKNINTGAYSYNYDKCQIHGDKNAIIAQQRYIAALVKHVNPYTKYAYKDDPFIVGFEVNNEPCHSGNVADTENYINKMLSALKKAGNKKPVFYNVSHNMHVVNAYYNTAIQGTTYQWYPIGLVAGHKHTGNFLPYVDSYNIPFSNVKGFNKKARLVYEFDPADILYSYMYPAIARTFRSTGFQWITQFAYDPIDMAYANSEYQTHFLNLAYTPKKAISMSVAAEVAKNVKRGETFGTYPSDTIFSKAMVSYNQDLSIWNSGDKYYYSNSTSVKPSNISKLQSIKGFGNSPVVKYEGTGAYFLDRLQDGVWRLEVMPDAITVSDPFEKPSLQKEVVVVKPGSCNMIVLLPDLGDSFKVKGLNKDNNYYKEAINSNIEGLSPGVYLLVGKNMAANSWNADTKWNNITLGEYVMPREGATNRFYVVNKSASTFEKGDSITLVADIVGPSIPDSVIVYTDKVSFWNDKNPYYKMIRTKGYTYKCNIPTSAINKDMLRYNIVIDSKECKYTFPSNVKGTPLDWDYIDNKYYIAEVMPTNAPIFLVDNSCKNSQWDGLMLYRLPENSNNIYLQKNIMEQVSGRKGALAKAKYLFIKPKTKVNKEMNFEAGFITSNGFTYKGKGAIGDDNTIKVSLDSCRQTSTALLPYSYPSFLDKFFKPETELPFKQQEIEKLEVTYQGDNIEIEKIWIE